MKSSTKTGYSFGFASGIITPLGLMVGLYSGTHSELAVIGGILTIAVADSLSDALGIHFSKESEKKTSHKQVWEATFATFFSKMFFALAFLIPLLFFNLKTAVIVSVIWGFVILSILCLNIARLRKEKPFIFLIQHLLIAVIVVVSTYFLGKGINMVFG